MKGSCWRSTLFPRYSYNPRGAKDVGFRTNLTWRSPR
jgi:hypothetical protein